MSSTITANLLARKGDAAPSVVAPVKVPSRPTLVPRDDQPLASEPRQPDNAEKLRRIVVSITQEELERLANRSNQDRYQPPRYRPRRTPRLFSQALGGVTVPLRLHGSCSCGSSTAG